ncbi:MAG: hypothetical protein DGJ47_000900 [Rickettsiaceae bacterium]
MNQRYFAKFFDIKRNYIYVLFSIVFFWLAYNLFLLYGELSAVNADYNFISERLFCILILLLVKSLLFIISFLSNRIYLFGKFQQRISKLKKRIILAFSIGALIPMTLMAIFSLYFLNFGMESWFDKKITRVLNQSVNVGESYVSENVVQMKSVALAISNELNLIYSSLIRNRGELDRFLNKQAKLRSFDEAIIFKRESNTILAQTSLSFSLAFLSLPPDLIDRANNGEVVDIKCDSSKIRVLVKLKGLDDAYLLAGRLVNPKIVEHIEKTNGAVNQYHSLKRQIILTQIKFSIIFSVASFLMLVSAMIWGKYFAEKMVSPIRELVKAADRVKNGDLKTRVDVNHLQKDEIKVLSSSFNRMVEQLDCQNKELVIAQRALAWSDVARRVAHEIKNPLTPIQLSAEMLKKKFANEVDSPESFRKYIDNILKNTNDIKNIVSEFVDFARLPAPNFSKCNVYSLIMDMVESRRLINANINYVFKYSSRDCHLVCDVSQINRVLVNLLLNAEEALEGCRKNSEIVINLIVKKGQLEIIMSDNGDGFSSDMLNRAKDAYVTTKAKGNGLGLSIVNRIISDHFGDMLIQNNNDGGGEIKLIFNTSLLNNQLRQSSN